MISTMTPAMTSDTYEQARVSSQQTLPEASFPRKYVHCVFDDPQDALQAFLELLAADYAARDIHILAYRDYMEAIERRQTPIGFLISINFDEHVFDEYLHESLRGHHIFAVRISRYEQMEQVRSLLAPHRAHLMKYIDTWTVADLLP